MKRRSGHGGKKKMGVMKKCWSTIEYNASMSVR